MGLAGKYLNFKNKILSYAREAALPFYILHQTVIVVIGFYISAWEMSVPLKYLFLASSSFIVVMTVYELPIRRVRVLRFLFGMKAEKKESSLIP